MTPFEEKLKVALQRQEPSTGFAARVLAKAAEQPGDRKEPKRLSLRQILEAISGGIQTAVPFSRMALTAILLILLAAGSLAYRMHLRTVQGQAAKEQLLLAIHIAGAQLHDAQLRIHQIESPEVLVQ